jgi:hypothetical protein
MTADALVSRHTAAWRAATVHPFQAGVRDGSVPENCFDRWLAQDYLYAQALMRAQSHIAAAARLLARRYGLAWRGWRGRGGHPAGTQRRPGGQRGDRRAAPSRAIGGPR